MPPLNLARSDISMTNLRKDKTFQALIGKLEEQLDKERTNYEDTSASEFNRGRVIMLRELLNELNK